MCQAKYTDELLTKTQMQDVKPCKTLMVVGTKLFVGDSEPYGDSTQYRSIIGALQYLNLTKPDLAFIVNRLSQFLKALSIIQWQVCKRVLRYIKGTKFLRFLLKPTVVFTLEACIDAD